MIAQHVWAPVAVVFLAAGASLSAATVPRFTRRQHHLFGPVTAVITAAAALGYAILQHLGLCESWRPELWADVFQRPL